MAENHPEQFEDNPAIIYVLDREFRLIYCNSAWDKFAQENGAAALSREKVIGCNVIEVTSAPLKPFYSGLYSDVLDDGRAVQRLYECSSADTYRRYRMQIKRATFLDSGPSIVVENSLVLQRPRQDRASGVDRVNLRDADGIITICSYCRKTKMPPGAEEAWVWIPDLIRSLPAGVSHGLCPGCFSIHYRGPIRPETVIHSD